MIVGADSLEEYFAAVDFTVEQEAELTAFNLI
jgi:hypothetical protein